MPDFNIYVAQGKDGEDLKKVGEGSGRTRADGLNDYLAENTREKHTEFIAVAKSNIGVLEVGEEPPKPPRRKITVKGAKKSGGRRGRPKGSGTAKRGSTAKKSSGTATAKKSSTAKPKPRTRSAGGAKKSGSPFRRNR